MIDQGQGAGQAIEDAASLAVMLQRGTPLSAIPERLKLYQKCRYERASYIQEISRVAGMDLGTYLRNVLSPSIRESLNQYQLRFPSQIYRI